MSFKFRWKHADGYTPDPAGPNMWAIFRQGAVDTRGPTYHSTNAAGWRNDQWDMTFNPRTGQSWTAAELNAGTEFGFQISSTPGAWNYITQAWVEVTYRAASDSTVYIGGIYEKKGDGSVTKYYQAYGRALAMRETPPAGGAGTLLYLLADHLGGTVAVLAAAGTTVAETKYWPYGATRTGGVAQTDKLYTGQQEEPGDAALGLYHYKARFYSTTLGRFVSADPVVSSTYDPRAWNAYSYVRNNPLRYTDPTGERQCDADGSCNGGDQSPIDGGPAPCSALCVALKQLAALNIFSPADLAAFQYRTGRRCGTVRLWGAGLPRGRRCRLRSRANCQRVLDRPAGTQYPSPASALAMCWGALRLRVRVQSGAPQCRWALQFSASWSRHAIRSTAATTLSHLCTMREIAAVTRSPMVRGNDADRQDM